MTDAERDERPERPAEVDGTTHLFRALGKQIKVLRERARPSQKDLGIAAHCGEDLISAIGRGGRTRQPDFLERVDGLVSAGGVLKAAINDVREAQSKARTRHPEWFRSFARAESAGRGRINCAVRTGSARIAARRAPLREDSVECPVRLRAPILCGLEEIADEFPCFLAREMAHPGEDVRQQGTEVGDLGIR
ncbi:helix-turn-helix domain-containing protein [Streptomyces sp. NPDC006283]|uniref:helix-turn-helix domain-containing protein n=1 Tax=Streptomyces sp. NPDC006283 TaxID=3156741 RepID=UPI0033B2F900